MSNVTRLCLVELRTNENAKMEILNLTPQKGPYTLVIARNLGCAQ